MAPQQRNHGKRKKKVRATVRPSTGALFMLRCAELRLTAQDLDEMTMGMVYDMLTEAENDRYDWPLKGTQQDIEFFFGK